MLRLRIRIIIQINTFSFEYFDEKIAEIHVEHLSILIHESNINFPQKIICPVTEGDKIYEEKNCYFSNQNDNT